ncbi:MAG: hypothetical protein ABJA10_10150 [Aestuariivirga sp.]
MLDPDGFEYSRQRHRDIKKALAPCVKEYGIDGVREVLDSLDSTEAQARPAGRPREYDDQTLLIIMIFVRNGMARTRLNVSKFCLKNALQLFNGGARNEIIDQISGNTLRRQFYNACQRFGVSPNGVTTFDMTTELLDSDRSEKLVMARLSNLHVRIPNLASIKSRTWVLEMLRAFQPA